MSFGTHRIKVSEREDHDTFDLNIMANELYNFDFDGKQWIYFYMPSTGGCQWILDKHWYPLVVWCNYLTTELIQA